MIGAGNHDSFIRSVLISVAVWFTVPAMTGCSWFGTEDEVEEAVESEGPSEPAEAIVPRRRTEDLEFKLAKLWARVDELEEQQRRQREKMSLLEKGLLTGLTPEGLLGDGLDKLEEVARKPASSAAAANPDTVDAHGQENAEKPTQGLTGADQERLQAILAKAHDHYRSGRYGRAIVEFSNLDREFADHIEGGMHRFFIAKCWLGLKDYNSARRHLEEFLKEYSDSPWIPRATFELARVEWDMGLQETALERFKYIIDKYPYEEAAEMAKMQLDHLDQTL